MCSDNIVCISGYKIHSGDTIFRRRQVNAGARDICYSRASSSWGSSRYCCWLAISLSLGNDSLDLWLGHKLIIRQAPTPEREREGFPDLGLDTRVTHSALIRVITDVSLSRVTRHLCHTVTISRGWLNQNGQCLDTTKILGTLMSSNRSKCAVSGGIVA